MAIKQKNETYDGYRSWFEAFRFNQRLTLPIFILDYETSSFWKKNNEEYSEYNNDQYQARSKLINGIQVYFIDENHKKRKAFLQHRQRLLSE